MTLDDVFGWSAIALCLIGMAALFIAGVTRPRGERIRCPGPAHRIFKWIDPRRPFIRGRCWYNLTGLPMDEEDHLRCPECGTRTKAARVVIDGRRVRIEAMGLMVMVLSIAAFLPPWLRGGSWTRSIPTLALAVVERAGGSDNSADIHAEVDRRITAGTVTGCSASILADALVQDLRDDEVHWNAHRAEMLLSQMGTQATPALTSALRNGDSQSRLLAARILRQSVNEPSPELLAACVEDLRDDRRKVDWYLSLGNASAAAEYLLTWSSLADEQLANGMRSADRQQRLLCAAVAGHARMLDLIDQAAPILIDHLRDNRIRGDANVAAPALFGFGERIVPYLQPYTDCSDKQLSASAKAIIERVQHPDADYNRVHNRMPHITDTTNDPLLSVSISDSASDLDW